MDAPLLSILTPSVPSRWSKLADLHAELAHQIGDGPVEHLIFVDNKRRTIGAKRDTLLRMARGKYVAFVDDDDWVSPDYVSSILETYYVMRDLALPDVITFRQRSIINGESGEIEFKLGNPNENFKAGGVTRRNAWHICAWRRDVAVQSSFPDTSYGEDWGWAEPLCKLAWVKEHHIPRVLHEYRFDSATSEAAN